MIDDLVHSWFADPLFRAEWRGYMRGNRQARHAYQREQKVAHEIRKRAARLLGRRGAAG